LPRGSHILIVDDDLDIREGLSEVLEERGYAILSAANGREALEGLRSGSRPCVILLDLMMPVMDGYEFRAEQRKDPALASIPVVIITAGAADQREEIEASAVLRKPLDLRELVDVIQRHC